MKAHEQARGVAEDPEKSDRLRLRNASLDAVRCQDTLQAMRKGVATVERYRVAALGEAPR